MIGDQVELTTRLGESEWFRARFGDTGPAMAEALIRAGRHAHDTSAETKATSGLRTDEPYGATFWQVLALTLLEETTSITGTNTIRPKGSRFEIPVVNGTTVYAAKCSKRSGQTAGTLRMTSSHFRTQLFSEVGRIPASVLPLPDWAEEDAPEAPKSADEAVVLAAFVASDRGGLQSIFVGDGYLDADDNIIWLHVESLPVASSVDVVTSAPYPVAPRFDEGPTTEFDMELRDDESALEKK